MKKIFLILIVIFIFTLTGCSTSSLEKATDTIKNKNFTIFVNETIVYEFEDQSNNIQTNNYASQYLINVDKDKMLYTKDNIKKYYEQIDDKIYLYLQKNNEWVLNNTTGVNEFKFSQLDFLNFETNQNYVQKGNQCNLDKEYVNNHFKETLNRYCILTFGDFMANYSMEIDDYSILLKDNKISMINIEIELNNLDYTNKEKYKITLTYQFSNVGTTVVSK